MSTGGKLKPRTLFGAIWKAALLVLVIWFWWDYLRTHAAELESADILPHWPYVAAAGGVYFCGYLLLGALWRPFLREFTGIGLSWSSAFRASAVSWAGRYIPGKVLTVAAKTLLSNVERKRMPAVGAVVMLEAVWSQLACVCVAISFASFCRFSALPEIERLRIPVLCAMVLVLVLMHPRVFKPLANRALAIIGRPALSRVPSFGKLAMLLCGHMLVFFFFTAGFMLLLGVMCPVDWTRFAIFVALFCFAWSVGFWSLFAPAGIGVRDSILTYGLDQVMGYDATAVIVAVVGARILMTAVEALCFAIAVFMPGICAFDIFSRSRADESGEIS